MKCWTRLAVAIALSFVLLVGCERRSGSGTQVASPTTIPEIKPRPTTQQLLNGPFRPFVVQGIPISVMAPASWKIDSAAHLTVLEGPMPTEDAMIQIAQRDPLKPEEVNAFIDHMKREVDGQTGAFKRMNVRDTGVAKIIEQLYSQDPMTSPKLDSRGIPVTENGNVTMVTVTPIHWMVSMLVPSGKMVNHYDVDCIGLSMDSYAANKELLEKVMASVKYESAAPSSAP